MSDIVEWFGGLNALLGAWLIALPFVFEVGGGFEFWNYLVVGAGILALSGYNTWESAADEDESGSSWPAVGSLVLGAWLVLTPFVFEVGSRVVFWNDVVVGLVVATLAAFDAYEARASDSEPTAAGG